MCRVQVALLLVAWVLKADAVSTTPTTPTPVPIPTSSCSKELFESLGEKWTGELQLLPRNVGKTTVKYPDHFADVTWQISTSTTSGTQFLLEQELKKSLDNGKTSLSCTKTFTVLCPSPSKLTLEPQCHDSNNALCTCGTDNCPLDDTSCNKFKCDYYIISDKSMMYNLVFDTVFDSQAKKDVYKVTATSTPLYSGCGSHALKGYTWKAILQPGTNHSVALTPWVIIGVCAGVVGLLLLVGALIFFFKTCKKGTCASEDSKELKQPIMNNTDYSKHNYENNEPTDSTVTPDFLECHVRTQAEGTQKTYKCTMCRALVDRHVRKCPSCHHSVKRVLEYDPIKGKLRVKENKYYEED